MTLFSGFPSAWRLHWGAAIPTASKFFAVVGVSALLVSGSVSAAPITYTEGVDLGDEVSVITDLGALDIGTNTVSGSIVRPGDTLDHWSATLAAGLQITSITLDLTYGATCTSSFFGATRNLRFDGGLIANTGFTCDSGLATDPFGSLAFPLTSPGEYSFLLGNINTGSPFLSVTSYTWAVEVAAISVPETATIAVFGFGVAGLSFAARRRRSA